MIVLSRGAVSPLHCPHCPHSPVVTLYCYTVGCNVVMDDVVMNGYNVAFTWGQLMSLESLHHRALGQSFIFMLLDL